MKKLIVLTGVVFLTCFSLFVIAQEKDPVLMTIGDKKVNFSEFMNVYNKNSNRQIPGDEKSLEEYLELFVNFKLKVKEAESLGLDTTSAFINELAGYRKQLSQPYLTDNAVNDNLLSEAYERHKIEISASHILVNVSETALPKDTLAAYMKIIKTRERILKGEDFGELAKRVSEDPSAKENSGNLGYFTAMQMVYPFETAAFITAVGEVSMPVRTRFGYHLVKVLDKRTARGQILVAHIMVENPKEGSGQDPEAAKSKIVEIHKKAKSGEDFAQLASQYSDDKSSAKKGGELPWFGTGRMVPEFENASFQLLSKSDISEPFQTRFGWHIVKMVDKKEIPTFEEMKSELKNKISKDSRSQLGRVVLISKIKKEYGFKENIKNRDELVKYIDSTFFIGEWKASSAKSLSKPLFTIGQSSFTQKDFVAYLDANQSKRPDVTVQVVVILLYNSFVENEIISYEESRLEQKYPEFKALMQEYRDGILLFELTDRMVWSKAVNDTVGLEAFYQENKNNFMWNERVKATIYSNSDNTIAKQTRKIVSQSKKKGYSSDDIVKMVNINSQLSLKAESGKFQKGENDIIDIVTWAPGISQDINKDSRVVFVQVHEKLAPVPKTLKESRGMVTAEYQSYLEKQWIKELKAKYPVTINKEVLSLIK
ncbi:MAG: peptidylprolyl isomerase [Bacteroidetes bacterium]|nr:peptidylprolyl isomerase [Bacteroidota bacterium]HET6244932.1 peptidylprolyl isomerase [Bacteroidia bacterium]